MILQKPEFTEEQQKYVDFLLEQQYQQLHTAVAVTVAPIVGTPYIAGPRKFCLAMEKAKNKYNRLKRYDSERIG